MGRMTLPRKQHYYHWERVSSGEQVFVNKHHVVWQKANYTSKAERAYRGLDGLILPLAIDSHNDLHANVLPPRKPSAALMSLAVEFNEAIDIGNDYEIFDDMIGFFQEEAETSTSPERASEAYKVASNFILQRSFVEAGAVRVKG